jgi:hypothetical protein
MDVFESSTGRSMGRFSSTYPVAKFHANALKTILRYGMGGGPTAMVRASMSPAGGFDERIPSASDWLYWIELARRGTMHYLPVTLTRYRRHNTNATRDQRNLFPDLLRTIEIIGDKYPELRQDTRYAHARLCYSRAIHNVRDKKWTDARKDLRESIRLSWTSWKWFVWYLRTFIRK